MRFATSLVATLAIIPAAFLQGDEAALKKHANGGIRISPVEKIRWTEGPPSLPRGAQIAVLEGDPTREGPFVFRVKVPDGYRVPPHTHPVFESVTVMSGSMGSGMGEKADTTKGKMLGPGSLLLLPADHAHYVWTGDEETIIQVAAIGPFDLIYVNPEDDPRKK